MARNDTYNPKRMDVDSVDTRPYDGDKAQRVDNSVRLGALGKVPNTVPMERTMAKPQAYRRKVGT